MNAAIFLNGHIFSILSDYLNDKDIIKFCLLTNKNMKNMIAHSSNRHFLFYNNFKFIITMSNLENTIRLNSVVNLDFSDETELTGTILLNLLQKCTNLKYIDLSNTLVNEFEINYITLNFPTIKQCSINGIVISINLLENNQKEIPQKIKGTVYILRSIKDIDGIIYMNDGDWVESMTALVEHHDGKWEIITWTKETDNEGKNNSKEDVSRDFESQREERKEVVV